MDYKKFLKKVENGYLSDKGSDTESEGGSDADSVGGDPEFGEVDVENDKEGDLMDSDSEKEEQVEPSVGSKFNGPEYNGSNSNVHEHDNSEFEKQYADHLKEEADEKMFPEEEEIDPTSLIVGSKFMNKAAFYKHVTNFCVINKHQTMATKSSTIKLRVKCIHWRSLHCPFFISGIVKKGEGKTFILMGFNLDHNCNGNKEDMSKCANPSYVADWYYEKTKSELGINEPVPCADDLATQFNKARKVNIRYHTAWRARVKVLEKINGNYEKSYKLVPAFCEMVKERNPGSIATFSYGTKDNTFLSMTICFKATMDGFFAGCRKVIGLDACHLYGKYAGVMLHATALDGQNGLPPLGIMV
ncbi:uncharacterized protein LOC113342733 [Papaver somniferum]|uniref:uncharacterized protein LOC113342733 n=1 Tax=Papaver somniferum TaxID=3469 RepID=UPI000E6FD0D9|nr:uncharacterized protein LOC113342733 [Papaver somniferum]XP_026442960.1 uncharacterized protein LOC113342733 [Papaver somniferum]